MDNEAQIADGSNHFSNHNSWNDFALKVRASTQNSFGIFVSFWKKCNTAWDKHTLTHTHMRRWDRMRCLCPCHGWHFWTAWHRWSGKTNAGGRNGRWQKNNIHLVVFPAIFRLRCVNIRGAKVCKRGPPPLSEMSVPAAFRGGPHKADCKKKIFLFSPCSTCVINTSPTTNCLHLRSV